MELLLSRIAEVTQGEVKGDMDKIIRDVAPFDTASEDDITCASEAKYLKRLEQTNAGAVIVPKTFEASTKNIIQVDNPRLAFAKVLELFYPSAKPMSGISSKVSIGQPFSQGQEISIAPYVVIGDNVTLGHRVILYPNVVIGDNIVIGDDVKIYPNVTILDRTIIGNRVTIHAGSVIGSDGFGFVPDGEKHYKIPHTGIVQIDDDVEIGAGNTIDRATFGKTWIKKGVKTDNLVHIGHNVTVGENSILVAQVGISGSVTIGKHAVLAGQAGVGGHLTIGDNVIIGPQAGVAQSVPDGEVLSGTLAMPHRIWLRVQKIIPQLPELKKRLTGLEKKLKKIEGSEGENG
ncbi:MAG: UDP-3-O-(3-hydroxymyristoyl)glucosamine N-acyltransferase [Desulfobacterales bacterium]|nr:MAG: UDP-3-O-(3-hydroxymyristoyl)glucosamine N-acyltransferase [Desulfobacterales bacterium]